MKFLLKKPILLGLTILAFVMASESFGLTNIAVTLGVNSNITNNLTHHWSLDGSSALDFGETNEVRSLTSSTHGNLVNMDTSNVTPGATGQGLSFDGVDEYVDFGDDSTLELSVPFSVSAWIKLDTLPSSDESYAIISKYDDQVSSTREWEFYVVDSSDKLRFVKYRTGGLSLDSAFSTTAFTSDDLNRWIHVAFTLDSSGDWVMYIDGESDNSGNFVDTTINTSTSFAHIGAIDHDTTSPDYFFDGAIDDVRVYSASLNGNTVRRLYQMGATTKISKTIRVNSSLESGLVSHWTFDGPQITYSGSSAVIEDHTDANDATYNGVNGGWYDSDFPYRLSVTIDSAQVSSTLSDFPVYVDLSDLPSEFWSNVQSDGDDIRVTSNDGTTEVPFDLVSIDTGGSAGELHFKASSLSGSSDTDFYIYYGDASASAYAEDATYGSENVWTNDYIGVWHLEEDGNTTSGGYVDKTDSDNDATGVSLTSSSDVSAQLGKGQSFDGTADYLSLPTSINNDLSTEATVSMWIKLDVSTPVGQGQTGFVSLSNPDKNAHYVWTDGYIYDSVFLDTRLAGVDNSGFSRDVWHMVTITQEPGAGNHIFYQNNGVTFTGAGESDISTATAPAIGLSPISSRYLDGTVDEVRLSSTVRSADWVSTEYNNQSDPDSFYTVGSQEVIEDLTREQTRPGRLGQSLYFDEVDDYVEAPYDSSLNPGTFSVAAWVRAETFGSTQSVVSSRSITASDEGYILYIRSGVPQLWNGNGSGGTVWDKLLGSTLETGRWYHVIGTYDGTNQRLYVNGELDAGPQAAGLDVNNENPLRIGAGQNEGSANFFFHGDIDDVRIYNRALSDEEARRLYGLGATTHIGKTIQNTISQSQNPPKLFWNFDGLNFLPNQVAGVLDSIGSNNATTTLLSSNVRPGRHGRGVYFDGTAGNITLNDETDLDIGTGDFSVSLWVDDVASSGGGFSASEAEYCTSFFSPNTPAIGAGAAYQSSLNPSFNCTNSPYTGERHYFSSASHYMTFRHLGVGLSGADVDVDIQFYRKSSTGASSVEIEYSSDNSSWTSCGTSSLSNGNNSVSKTCSSVTATDLYVRISITNNPSNIVNLLRDYQASSPTPGQYFMSSSNTSNDAGWEIGIENGNLCFSIDDGGGFPDSPDDSACYTWPTAGSHKWRHIVATKDSSEIKLYVNNVEVASDSSLSATGSLSGSPLLTVLGGAVGGGSDYITATFDNVRFYDRVLTETERSFLYEKGL